MLLCDEYLTPKSLDDAFDLIEANRGRYRLVAGATDLLPWAREGRAGDVHIPVLIDVSRIAELRERYEVSDLPVEKRTLRSLVRRRPVAGGRDHRRQCHQCVAGGRRYAAAIRA